MLPAPFKQHENTVPARTAQAVEFAWLL